MPYQSSTRRPWPFHMRLGSILGSPNDRLGLMLVAGQNGLLVGKKQQMLDQVVPSEQEYGSAPVYRERTWTGRPIGGYGERVQSSYGDRRYYWGSDIQVSGGLFGKGPLLHPVVPTTAAGGPVIGFVDAPNASSTYTQLILANKTVYRRADDTDAGQQVDHTFAALISGYAVFQGGYAGSSANLYVACWDGTLWERTPAGAWAACAVPSGFQPTLLEVVGTELWAADASRSI